jgi:hypothetical protein
MNSPLFRLAFSVFIFAGFHCHDKDICTNFEINYSRNFSVYDKVHRSSTVSSITITNGDTAVVFTKKTKDRILVDSATNKVMVNNEQKSAVRNLLNKIDLNTVDKFYKGSPMSLSDASNTRSLMLKKDSAVVTIGIELGAELPPGIDTLLRIAENLIATAKYQNIK